jgi:hypothetical protein
MPDKFSKKFVVAFSGRKYSDISAYWHWEVSFIEEFYVKFSVSCN